ncbi:hypothetical protein CC80DRAFT_314514 [Byssothecium circinans]|uniref:Helicase C-terminal domain-containing protein n=1 Tax=Byssothecium circinans TaxID=147558 RepID=A0A6A5T9U4_9PLEO|nr:hypothetical protein CC80DRAFT_314514 [Byssothecium circinans]
MTGSQLNTSATDEWSPDPGVDWSTVIPPPNRYASVGNTKAAWGIDDDTWKSLVDDLRQYLKEKEVYEQAVAKGSTQSNTRMFKRQGFHLQWFHDVEFPRFRHPAVPPEARDATASTILTELKKLDKWSKPPVVKKDGDTEMTDAGGEKIDDVDRRRRSSSASSHGSVQLGQMSLRTSDLSIRDVIIHIVDQTNNNVLLSISTWTIWDPFDKDTDDGVRGFQEDMEVDDLSFERLLARLELKIPHFKRGVSTLTSPIDSSPITTQATWQGYVQRCLTTKQYGNVMVHVLNPTTIQESPIRDKKRPFEEETKTAHNSPGPSQESFHLPRTEEKSDLRESSQGSSYLPKSNSESSSTLGERSGSEPEPNSDKSQNAKTRQTRKKAHTNRKRNEKKGGEKVEKATKDGNSTGKKVAEKSSHAANDTTKTKPQHNATKNIPPNNGARPSKSPLPVPPANQEALEIVSDAEEIKDPDEEDNEVDEEKARLNEEADKRRAIMNSKANDELMNKVGRKIERCTLDDWSQAATFFGVSLDQMKNETYIELPRQWHLPNVQFTPYQLTEAFHMYMMEISWRNGGVLGNMMGMGKTRTMLLMLVVGHVHLLLWLEWRRAKKLQDNSRHNIRNHENLRLDDRCPSRYERTFRCVCEQDCPFGSKPPRLAVTLISGAGTSVNAWLEEVKQWLVGSYYMHTVQCKYPMRFCFCMKNKDSALPPPTEDELSEMRIATNLDEWLNSRNNAPGARESSKVSAGNRTTMETEYKLHEMEEFENFTGSTPRRPAPSAGRFFLIVGHNSFISRIGIGNSVAGNTIYPLSVVKVQTTRKEYYRPTTRGQWIERHAVKNWSIQNRIVFGRIVYDEYHNAKGEHTTFPKFYDHLRNANQNMPFKVWGLSGTPMETGLQEMYILIRRGMVGMSTAVNKPPQISAKKPFPDIARWKEGILERTPEYDGDGSEASWEAYLNVEVARRDKEEGNPYGNWATWVAKYDREKGTGEVVLEFQVPQLEDLIDEKGIDSSNAWKRMADRIAKSPHDEIYESEQWRNAIKLGHEILPLFMIRRTLKTRDPWGRKIAAIEGQFKTEFVGCQNDTWRDTIRKAISDLATLRNGATPSGAFKQVVGEFFSRHEQQAIATFPGLAHLKGMIVEKWMVRAKEIAERDGRKFNKDSAYLKGSAKFVKEISAERMTGYDKIRQPDAPAGRWPLTENLTTCIADSEKLKTIIGLCRDTKQRTGVRAVYGAPTNPPKPQPCKILIGSYKPVVLMLLREALTNEFGEEAIAYCAGHENKIERSRTADRWRSEDSRFILLASVTAFAESITLVEADTVVLVEPQDRVAKQDQFLFRIYRIGQLASLTTGLILCNARCPSELTILQKQHFKQATKKQIQEGEKDGEAVISTVDGAQVDWRSIRRYAYVIDGLDPLLPEGCTADDPMEIDN